MDLYDIILSDAGAEIKATRNAYLKIFGTLYTGLDAEGEEIDINTWMKQTSSMQFPVNEDGNRIGDAEFLEKNINDSAIENMLNRLRASIYEKSGSFDVRAISESSGLRVIAIKAMLMRLENNCSTTESYLKVGFNKMFRLFSYWLKSYHNISSDPNDFVSSFERVFPTDMEARTKIFSELSATLDLKDALKLAGFDDYEAIAARALGMED